MTKKNGIRWLCRYWRKITRRGRGRGKIWSETEILGNPTAKAMDIDTRGRTYRATSHSVE